MNYRDFYLQPFPGTGPWPPVQITGAVARGDHTLKVRCVLLGRLAELVIPPPANLPARRHALWEETCFELFLAAKGSPRYWEFNLSPAGHWNVYCFAGYRQGMEEDRNFNSLPFNVQRRRDFLLLTLEVEIAKTIPPGQALEMACAAIIKLPGGEITYWALTHFGPEPDFHRRNSFSIEL